MAIAKRIASPPIRGIGWSWILRKPGLSRIPVLTESHLASGVKISAPISEIIKTIKFVTITGNYRTINAGGQLFNR